MYPKGKKGASSLQSRPRKRQFQGNQFENEDKGSFGDSASARKLKTANNEDVVINPLHCYRIIEFLSVFGALAEILICRKYKKDIKFQESGHRGIGFKIVVVCQCETTEINSGPFVNNAYEINRRIIFVMRILGVARQGLNIFCGLMDICQGISKSTYDNYIKNIHSAATTIFDIICKKAVKEEMAENEKHGRSPTNLKISGDGSWKKRGFTSMYGVTTLIGHYSGKVVDIVAKGSYCQSCTYWKTKINTPEYLEWKESHDEDCRENHSGSAGKMEVDSIKEMFQRSMEKFQVRYGNYIGDGDSKTFKAILDLNPYGDDLQVIKSECVCHVEKRMGSRLRDVKKKEKLGGKGKLTEAFIKKLTKYYGLAH